MKVWPHPDDEPLAEASAVFEFVGIASLIVVLILLWLLA